MIKIYLHLDVFRSKPGFQLCSFWATSSWLSEIETSCSSADPGQLLLERTNVLRVITSDGIGLTDESLAGVK